MLTFATDRLKYGSTLLILIVMFGDIVEPFLPIFQRKGRWQSWLLVSCDLGFDSFHSINCIENYTCNMNIFAPVYTEYQRKERCQYWLLVSRDVSFSDIVLITYEIIYVA